MVRNLKFDATRRCIYDAFLFCSFYLLYEDHTLYLHGKTNSMSITENRQFYACNEAQCMFMGIFSIAQRLKAMQLKVVELAVFSAIVSVNW